MHTVQNKLLLHCKTFERIFFLQERLKTAAMMQRAAYLIFDTVRLYN